ncbi:MAG: glycosyltransferase [Bacteroidota bacterium]|nr:glycosyltransferase [Bacteroidota bacterium]
MNGVVILPNHNDWSCLLKLVPSIEHQLSQRTQESWHILVVDDASTTPPPAEWSDLNVTLLKLITNQGHQGAIFQGLQWAVAHLNHVERFVVMDADGEDDPKALPLLLAKSADVVFARRGKRHAKWQFRVGYLIYRQIFKLVTGKSMMVGNYAVIQKDVALSLSSTGFIHFAARLMNWKGSQAFLSVDRLPRLDGQPQMTSTGLVYHGLRSLIENMEALVHWMLRLFLAVMAGVCGLGGYVLTSKYIIGNAVPGWTSIVGVGLVIAALVCFIGFVLGLIALNLQWQLRTTSEQPILVSAKDD